MLVLASEILDLPVLGLQTGTKLATVSDIVIARETGMVLGLSVGNNQVIVSNDIREVQPDMVVIDSYEDLTDTEDVMRIYEVLKEKFSLMGMHVETEMGSKIGKVYDYAINLKGSKLAKLYVRPNMIKSLLADENIIDVKQIVTINKDKIVVKDGTKKLPAAVVQPAFDG